MFKKLTLKSFMVFKNGDFNFASKLNIIVGENGSGKTQLLKLLYALGKITASKILIPPPKGYIDYRDENFDPKDEVNGPLKGVFCVNQSCDLIHWDSKTSRQAEKAEINVFSEENGKRSAFCLILTKGRGDNESFDTSGITYCDAVKNEPYDSEVKNDILFFQAREMLSIYKNFRSLNDKYRLPYDSSMEDTVSKLGMPYLRNLPDEFQHIIQQMEHCIRGKIYLQNEQFYFRPQGMPEGKHDWDVNMAAEGWRKMAMLLQVLKNGELHEGVTFLWDEPDANLNPALVKILASVIVELSTLGIQVFLTTHNLFLLKELDMLIKEKGKFSSGDARYFNFTKPGKVEQGNTPEDLTDILMLDESLRQSDRYLQMED